MIIGRASPRRPPAVPGLDPRGQPALTAHRARRTDPDPGPHLRLWEATSLAMEAGEAGGGMLALPAAVPAHALRQGRNHRDHTAAVLAAAGERLDSLGGQASRGGFLALLGHLGAQRGHLDSDRGARGRDDSVSAERPRCRASGAGVHADSIPCSLPRDVRGLRPLTGRGTSKLGVSCSSLFWVASRGWVGMRPLGLGWDGEMVVRR